MQSMLNVAKYIKDDDMKKVITSAATKLGLLMTDDEFEKTEFTFTEWMRGIVSIGCNTSIFLQIQFCYSIIVIYRYILLGGILYGINQMSRMRKRIFR